jgi:hypothetical protein
MVPACSTVQRRAPWSSTKGLLPVALEQTAATFAPPAHVASRYTYGDSFLTSSPGHATDHQEPQGHDQE